MEDLAASIRDHTLQIPVTVQPWNKNGFAYRLLAGHRRFVAYQILQQPMIPAYVRRDLDEHGARLLNFMENLTRKDLNPLEEAQALGRLYPNGIPLRAAAKELNQSTDWIHNRFRLLKLPEEIQQAIAAGLLRIHDVPRLVTLPTPEGQIKADPPSWPRNAGTAPRCTCNVCIRSTAGSLDGASRRRRSLP